MTGMFHRCPRCDRWYWFSRHFCDRCGTSKHPVISDISYSDGLKYRLRTETYSVSIYKNYTMINKGQGWITIPKQLSPKCNDWDIEKLLILMG